jgi:hypothetical protein
MVSANKTLAFDLLREHRKRKEQFVVIILNVRKCQYKVEISYNSAFFFSTLGMVPVPD